MTLAEVCDSIASIVDPADRRLLAQVASQCESFLGHVDVLVDTVENTLRTADGSQQLALWFFIDRLGKQHEMFLSAFRPRVLSLATTCAPKPGTAEWGDFEVLLKSSFAVLFGEPLVALLLMELDPQSYMNATSNTATPNPHVGVSPTLRGPEVPVTVPSKSADARPTGGSLVVHGTALRSHGAFITKQMGLWERTGENKHKLQVKTLDSQMAMNVASSYAPAKPTEIAVPVLRPDRNAPRGYMQALPENHAAAYQRTRRKRLREIMEAHRQEQDRRQEEEQLQRVRMGQTGATLTRTAGVVVPDFSDIQMPSDLPRDEYGVKRGNFPLGVKFIRDAIASCGGALPLDVIVRAISTMANKEVVSEFGDVREFLLIHKPTFRIVNERGVWIVRLVEPRGLDGELLQPGAAATDEGDGESTWEKMSCPRCTQIIKGRNLARHLNCRRCITIQIALGLQGDYQRSAIAELAHLSKLIIAKYDTGYSGTLAPAGASAGPKPRCLDGYDMECYADCLQRAAQVRRFRLASTVKFAPVMKAMRVIRNTWLAQKHSHEVADAVPDVHAGDAAVIHVLRTFGRYVHRFPIPWIEMGEVIDMCKPFSTHVEEAFNPPPRPADPRINLNNEYPGLLFCESEVDSEDDPSGDDENGEYAYSDDEAPTFTFAPPVELAESVFTAGFPRDTKKLQHRMRTAPPLVLQRVLESDRSLTQSELYTQAVKQSHWAAERAPPETVTAVGGSSSTGTAAHVRRF